MAAKKELQVSAVENGTVIDHIPANKLFDVINILGIQSSENTVTFGYNLNSAKLGKKAIIKILTMAMIKTRIIAIRIAITNLRAMKVIKKVIMMINFLKRPPF